MVRSLPLLAGSGRAHERVCGCLRECVYDGERERVLPLYICGSGSCVRAVYRWPAGQQLYRGVEERQEKVQVL